MALAAAAVGGCGRTGTKTATTAPGSTELLKIAVIPKGTTYEFWKAMHAGAVKAELELKGVHVTWKGPLKEGDREQQINIVENFINAGYDGIAIAPLDAAALVRPIREARRAGIDIVILDSALEGEVGKDFASYVATDNYLGGQKAARRLGEVLGGKGNVLMLRYAIGSASTEQREAGFLDVMTKEFPDINLVSTDQHSGETTELAFNKAQNLLNSFPDLDGIFTTNESSTFGTLRALQEAGLAGKIKLVGFDASEKLIQAMRDGTVHGLVMQDPFNMGYTGVKHLVAHIRGETVPELVDTGCEVATPANMDEPRIARLLRPPLKQYLE
jgi:ribose transport system substrate-binding protein